MRLATQLKRITDYQASTHGLDDMYNEIIVPSAWWLHHNPDMVEAIFGDRNAHRRFLAAFASHGVTASTHPFVELDRSNWNSPMR